MSLKPNRTALRRPKLFTWDLEWNPETMKLRLAGLFDGQRYQAFHGIPALMRAMLTRENRGAWFFAHAGGTFDVSFLLDWFVTHPDYTVEMRFSGSAAVFVEIRKGKDVWNIVDSFFLMRDSLAKIAKSLGMTKGTDGKTEAEKKDLFMAPMAELEAYNEQDCRILHAALTRFRDELEGIGGELKPTIASCALTLFKRAFLKSPIRTDEALNDMFRDAYIASRVEVFRKKVTDPPVYKYDINSSFPSSMTEPVPGSLMHYTRRMPAHDCFMAQVTVDVSDRWLPPLPYRIDGRVFFPLGQWKAIMAGPDVRFAEETGVLRSVHKVWVYEPRDDFAEYVHTIYGKRKASEDEFYRLLLKYLLNSLYGKTGERPEKTSILINPPGSMHRCPGAVMLRPGVWRVSSFSRAPHEHIPIAAHITAKSRAKITRYLLDAERAGHPPYYCDTDSIITKAELEQSLELGRLKFEKEIGRAEFHAPKFYYQNNEVIAKGFRRGLTVDDYHALVNGGAQESDRMLRPKEMWRIGDLTPRQKHVSKRALLTLDKRRFSEDGESTPYHLSEIPALIGKVPEQLGLRGLLGNR